MSTRIEVTRNKVKATMEAAGMGMDAIREVAVEFDECMPLDGEPINTTVSDDVLLDDIIDLSGELRQTDVEGPRSWMTPKTAATLIQLDLIPDHILEVVRAVLTPDAPKTAVPDVAQLPAVGADENVDDGGSAVDAGVTAVEAAGSQPDTVAPVREEFEKAAKEPGPETDVNAAKGTPASAAAAIEKCEAAEKAKAKAKAKEPKAAPVKVSTKDASGGTIKEFVFDMLKHNPGISGKDAEDVVRKAFPNSQFKGNNLSWYRKRMPGKEGV